MTIFEWGFEERLIVYGMDMILAWGWFSGPGADTCKSCIFIVIESTVSGEFHMATDII